MERTIVAHLHAWPGTSQTTGTMIVITEALVYLCVGLLSAISACGAHDESLLPLPKLLVKKLIPQLRKRPNGSAPNLEPEDGGGPMVPVKKPPSFDVWDDRLLLDVIPIIMGQRGCNENGTLERYRDLLLSDESNDDIVQSSTEEIIERSGYEYDKHESLSDDGYSTKLLRLKNPLMRGRHLKQPPVMMLQAGPIGSNAFIWASSIQHKPELPSIRPRAHLKDDELDPERAVGSLKALIDDLIDPDIPVLESAAAAPSNRSSSRSLAFVLANQGYDVWLVESRGHRSKFAQRDPLGQLINSVDRTTKSVASLLFGHNKYKNMTLGESLVQLTKAPHYWTYSFDEIVEHEMKNQIKKVLEVSNAHNVTLVSYSFASMVTLPFLASRPKFVQKRVHNLVLMAPILSHRGANTLFNYIYSRNCLSLPDDFIAFFGTAKIFTKPLRKLLIQLGKSAPKIRYKVLKFLLYLLQGPSPQYRTFLEPAVYGHLFEPTSFLQVKHFCQQVLARKYQRYNYGPIKNRLVYGQHEPPAYDLSRLNLPKNGWLLISGETDNLGTKDSIEQLLAQVNPGPAEHIEVPGFAHLDLVAAIDNDVHVNLPILHYLEQHRYYLD